MGLAPTSPGIRQKEVNRVVKPSLNTGKSGSQYLAAEMEMPTSRAQEVGTRNERKERTGRSRLGCVRYGAETPEEELSYQ